MLSVTATFVTVQAAALYAPLISGVSGNFTIYGAFNANTTYARITGAGVSGGATGGEGRFFGGGRTNETGNAELRSSSFTRAVSTAYNVTVVTVNTTGEVVLIDNVLTGNALTRVIIKNGAVVAITGDTATYVSGAPATAQMGFTVAAGFLVATTGATWPTRKVGFNVNLTEQV